MSRRTQSRPNSVAHSVATAPEPTSRDAWALAGYAGLAALLLSPVRHYFGSLKKVNRAKFEEDSFPLSTYPMFSADRRGRIVVPHVVGFTAMGERVIPHYRHYGTGGLNQVRKQISRAIRKGRAVAVAQRYADSIAEEQRTRGTEGRGKGAERRRREAEIVTIAVVRSRYVFDDYFDGKTQPQAEVVHAECTVGSKAIAHRARQLPRFEGSNQKKAA